MSQNAPAGWYPLPDGTQRYWDGQQWTEHIAPGTGVADTAPAASEPVAAEPVVAEPAITEPVPTAEFAAPAVAAGAMMVPPPAAPPVPMDTPLADARPWWKKKRFVIPGAVLVVIIAFSILTSGGGDDKDATASGPSAPATQAAQVPSETPDPSITPADDAAATTFAMPNVVGMDLQDAQDQLQGLGSYLLDQQDASGQGRMQILDADWVVCEQKPAPGTEADITDQITLSSVKDNETCPGDAKADEPAKSDLSNEQQQAVRKAEDYLDFTAFSRSGLIDQLVYEGFSKKDATVAVASMDVNWNKQAAKKAQEYLDLTSFSHKGLVDQLKFDGFTTKQALYGAKAVGL